MPAGFRLVALSLPALLTCAGCTLDFEAPFAETPGSGGAGADASLPDGSPYDTSPESSAESSLKDHASAEAQQDSPGADAPKVDAVSEDAACGSGEKRCEGTCVPIDEPATGCAADSCSPCAIQNAEAACQAGACVIGSCDQGFGDCDGALQNGCETATSGDPANCGSCGNGCAVPGGSPTCSGGVCGINCPAGFGNCDGSLANGCEAMLITDKANCGACGHGCCGGACQQGQCQPWELSNNETSPRQIAIDDASVYWTTMVTVRRSSKVVGNPVSVTSMAGFGTGLGIAVDDTTVFYGLASQGLKKVGKGETGATGQSLAGSPDAAGVKVDADYAYFHGTADIRRIMKAGGAASEPLASGQSGVGDMAIDGTHVYWTSTSADAVRRVIKTGGAIEELVTSSPSPSGLTVDANYVYFGDDSAQALARVPKAGGVPEVLSSGAGKVRRVAADDSFVYWTENGQGSVRRVPVGGGATTTLMTNVGGALGIALDEACIYFTDASSGSVYVLAKP